MRNQMADKRIQVIDAAIRLFAEKGYHSTSIQEIADAAGIAKGSMYLYFKSKDDLLLNIYRTFIERLFEEVEEAERNNSSPRDKLAALIRAQLDKILQYRDFITMQMREQFIHQNKEIRDTAFQIRVRAFSHLHERIIGLYGEEFRPWAMDCTNLFQSMISAYMGIMIFFKRSLDMDEMTEFLLGRLDDMAKGMMAAKPAPLLRQEDIDEFLTDPLKDDKFARIQGQIGVLRGIVQGLPETNSQRNDLLASLQVLEEELQKQEPKRVIVQGMLTYLLQSGLTKLKKPVKQLQTAAAALLEAKASR